MENWSRAEKLVRENEQLKIKMQSVMYENRLLKSNLQSFTCNTREGHTLPVGSSSLTRPSVLPQNTINEKQFTAGLLQSEYRSSSPFDLKSLVENSGYVESEDAGFESRDCLEDKEDSEKLLGELAYQLDRRILSFVFQSNKRFYGYNLTNIPSKIIEVSTHPLTGKVDEDYRHHLNQRYSHIKNMLSHLGYKITLHPQFSEFVVNTYGILMMRPEEGSSQAKDYYNPEYLKSIVMTTAPRKLQKDLLLLLDCLCKLAAKDGKPLLLWN